MNAIPSFARTGTDVASSLPSLAHEVSDASQNFESVLIGQWLQQAEASFGSVPGGEEEDSGGDQMKNFAMQHLAQEITKNGGIGISKIVEKALTTSAGIGRSVQRATAEPEKHTGPMITCMGFSR